MLHATPYRGPDKRGTMTQRREPDSRAIPHAGDGPSRDGVPVSWILAVLLRARRAILIATGVGVLLGVLWAVLSSPTYTSTFSFLPQSSDDGRAGGLASLAGQFGIPLGAIGGMSQPPQLYADLLKTPEVLAPIARESFPVNASGLKRPLSEFLNVHGDDSAVVRELTIRALREKVIASSVAVRTTNAVYVTVRTRSPQVSLSIAQRLLAGLNEYNRVTRQSQAAQERQFVEGRLAEARTSLRQAEDALQQFLQANRQFNSSPQLTFQQERLQREVALQQQLVTGLAEQFENARIREVRDTPVITLVERPRLAILPDPRGRVRKVIVSTLVACVLACAVVLGRAGWRRQQETAENDVSYAMLATEWRRVRETFKKA
jgi:uncharacterized protein involved in exopolysaccharide biosynthesis